MDFGNENLMKPLMYRDIMGPENTPMGAAYGCGMYGVGMYGGYMGGMYPTNMLGGVTMQSGLTQDTFQNYQRRQKKDNNFMKNTLLVLGGMAAMGLIRIKGIKNLWGKITNFFKKTPAPTSSPSPTASTGWWQKVKNIFKRKPAVSTAP